MRVRGASRLAPSDPITRSLPREVNIVDLGAAPATPPRHPAHFHRSVYPPGRSGRRRSATATFSTRMYMVRSDPPSAPLPVCIYADRRFRMDVTFFGACRCVAGALSLCVPLPYSDPADACNKISIDRTLLVPDDRWELKPSGCEPSGNRSEGPIGAPGSLVQYCAECLKPPHASLWAALSRRASCCRRTSSLPCPSRAGSAETRSSTSSRRPPLFRICCRRHPGRLAMRRQRSWRSSCRRGTSTGSAPVSRPSQTRRRRHASKRQLCADPRPHYCAVLVLCGHHPGGPICAFRANLG